MFFNLLTFFQLYSCISFQNNTDLILNIDQIHKRSYTLADVFIFLQNTLLDINAKSTWLKFCLSFVMINYQ